MDINEIRSGDFLILEPVGHLDTRTAGALEKKIVQHLGAGERRFIMDLGSTEYMSSAGLRVLLMLAKKAEADGEVILCSLNASIHEVFEIAGFTAMFTIAPDRQAALARASSRPKTAKLFNLAARLLSARKTGPEENEQVDAATARLIQRAAELLAIAEERDLKGQG